MEEFPGKHIGPKSPDPKDVFKPIIESILEVSREQRLGRIARNAIANFDKVREEQESRSLRKVTKGRLSTYQPKRPFKMPKVEYVDEDALRERLAEQARTQNDNELREYRRSQRITQIAEVYEMDPVSVEGKIELIEEGRAKGRRDSDMLRDLVQDELECIERSADGQVINAENVFALNAMYDRQNEQFLV